MVHENARLYVARVCQRFLEDEGIGQHVLQTWTHRASRGHHGSTHSAASKTHLGQPMSSPTSWLRSCRISILGEFAGLSEAFPGVVGHTFRHVGSYPLLMWPFYMIEWMFAILGQIHLSIITLFLVMITGISRQMVIPHSPWPILLRCVPDRLRHFYKKKLLNLKHSSSSYAMISECSPNCSVYTCNAIGASYQTIGTPFTNMV